MIQPGFIFGGDTGISEEEIKRRREIANAMMLSNMRAPRNVGEGLHSFGNSIGGAMLARKARQQDQQLKAGQKAEWNRQSEFLGGLPILGGGASASVPADTGNVAEMDPSDPEYPQARVDQAFNLAAEFENDPSLIGDNYSVQNAKAYIKQTAGQHGLNPDTVVRGLQTEGLQPGVWQSNVVKDGVREPSYGPAQMYMGGGLGNKMLAETGVDPSDPKNWKASLDYAMPVMAREGWKQWYGPQNSGIADPRSSARAPANQVAGNLSREQLIGLMQIAGDNNSPMSSVAKVMLQQQMQKMQGPDELKQLQLEAKRLDIEQKRRELAGDGGLGFKDYPAPVQAFMFKMGWENGIPPGMDRAEVGRLFELDRQASKQGMELVQTENGFEFRQGPGVGQKKPGEMTPVEEEAAAQSGETITTAAGDIRDRIDNFSTGLIGSLGQFNPQSDRAEIDRQLATLRGTGFIESVIAMKKQAGGVGSLSDTESGNLTAAVGALDPNSSPKDFRKQLNRFERTLLSIVYESRDKADQFLKEKYGEDVFNERYGGKPTKEDGSLSASSVNEGKRMKDQASGRVVTYKNGTWIYEDNGEIYKPSAIKKGPRYGE